MNEQVRATIVFEKIWNAINAKDEHGKPKYRYILLPGSSRSSKTHSIIQAFYLYSIQYPGKRLSVFRDTKTDCRATVGKDMQAIYPTMPFFENVVFNKTEGTYSFTNKSVIEINGTDEANRIHGYNGSVTWLCEPYDIPKDVFDQLDMRTTDFVIADLNPKQAHWSDELEKDPRTIVIRSTFKDNPYCPPEQKAKILSYQPVSACSVVITKLLTENEAKAYNLTENPLNLSEKQVKELARCKENERKGSASAFNWSVYGLGEKAERPNRIFNWSEISLDDYHKINAKRYYGVDWGVVDPWGIVEVKYYDGVLYLRELNYLSENQLMEGLSFTEKQQVLAKDEGLVMWHFNRLGIEKNAIIVCDDNRPMKIRALRASGYDYAVSAQKGAGSIIDGVNLLEKLKVYYTSNSANIKYEQENYTRKVDRYGIVLEEPEDVNNHCIDPTRYISTFLRSQGIIRII